MIPLVVTVTEQGSGAAPVQHEFVKSPVRIGRSGLNDLALRPQFVSTFHARVEFDERGATYTDLGSLNGSRLDGQSLDANVPTPLRPGAEVWIPDAAPEPGTFKLTFERKALDARAERPERKTIFAKRAASLVAEAPPLPEPVTPAAPEPPPVLEPEPPVVSAPPDPADEKAADEALRAAAVDLDLSYASYRGSWDHLGATIGNAIASLQGPAREVALWRLSAQYPEIAAEPQFLALFPPGAAPRGGDPRAAEPARAKAAPPRREAPPDEAAAAGDEALRLVRAFFESYLPAPPEGLGPAEVKAVLDRFAGVMEAFARSFLELERGYEEFGKDIGLRPPVGGPLARAAEARQLLAYLLDPEGSDREHELQRAFGDFMMHQLALLRGIEEGAQALLARVSPEAIEAKAPQSRWPMRAQALWKAFEERHRELADDANAVSEALFGKEFARAYYAMAGQGQPREPGGAARGTRELGGREARDEGEDGDAR